MWGDDMIEFFNEIMDCFRIFVASYFNTLAFAEGVAIGWILLTLSCFYIVIRFMIGRMK